MNFDVNKYLKILFDNETTIIDELNESGDKTDIITEDDDTSDDTLTNDWMKYVESIELTTKPFDEFKDIV